MDIVLARLEALIQKKLVVAEVLQHNVQELLQYVVQTIPVLQHNLAVHVRQLLHTDVRMEPVLHHQLHVPGEVIIIIVHQEYNQELMVVRVTWLVDHTIQMDIVPVRLEALIQKKPVVLLLTQVVVHPHKLLIQVLMLVHARLVCTGIQTTQVVV